MSNIENHEAEDGSVPEGKGFDPPSQPKEASADAAAAAVKSAKVDPSSAPVLQTWKTSTAFTVLGLVASVVLYFVYVILGLIITSVITGGLSIPGDGSWAAMVQSYMPGILSAIVVAVYLLVVYPSYFREKPLFKSSKVISFMNCAFGWGPFGLLWNHNLTKKDKGFGAIVLGVLESVFVVVGLAMVITASGASASNGVSSSTSQDQAVQQIQQGYYTDDTTGMTFVVPSGWDCWQEGNDVIMIPDDPDAYSDGYATIWIDYGSGLLPSDFDDSEVEDMLGALFSRCVISDSGQKRIGDIEYYVARARCFDDDGSATVDIRIPLHQSGEWSDGFLYVEYTGSQKLSPFHDDFEEMIAGASYE